MNRYLYLLGYPLLNKFCTDDLVQIFRLLPFPQLNISFAAVTTHLKITGLGQVYRKYIFMSQQEMN
jgi:hypothetical protein